MPLSDLALSVATSTSKSSMKRSEHWSPRQSIRRVCKSPVPTSINKTNKRILATRANVGQSKRTLWKINLLKTRRYNTDILLVSSTQWNYDELRGLIQQRDIRWWREKRNATTVVQVSTNPSVNENGDTEAWALYHLSRQVTLQEIPKSHVLPQLTFFIASTDSVSTEKELTNSTVGRG